MSFTRALKCPVCRREVECYESHIGAVDTYESVTENSEPLPPGGVFTGDYLVYVCSTYAFSSYRYSLIFCHKYHKRICPFF